MRGLELLKGDGYIANSQVWSKYKECRESLTRVIMQSARMILITTDSNSETCSRSPGFLANILVIDEYSYAKPSDTAVPMMATGGALMRIKRINIYPKDQNSTGRNSEMS